MNTSKAPQQDLQPPGNWLRNYYFTRAAFSIVWVATAFTIGHTVAMAALILALVYPAWDGWANMLDAMHNGGLRQNPTQLLNAIASFITTVAVAIASPYGMNAVVIVFGVWACLSGLLQLMTGVRRWRRFGAQWPMILSGAQSALAGVLFIQRSTGGAMQSITAVAPYAAFGAFYFLLSGISLTLASRRKTSAI
jgi:uncharacterized membrane protein HdeD (DUF308 family)